MKQNFLIFLIELVIFGYFLKNYLKNKIFFKNIPKEKFLLTDQNHNSLALLQEVLVDVFFREENESHAILLLREKNPIMSELLTSQVECKFLKSNSFFGSIFH